MASGSTGRSDRSASLAWERRIAASRGEKTPINLAGKIRLAVRLAGLLIALIALVPVHYIWRIFAYGSPIPKLFLHIAARIAGARVKRIGTPIRRDVFYISNHVSWVDILAIAGATGTAFVAKAELGEAPLVGWLCRLNRTLFVKREDRLGVAGQIDALREALADNWSITVFPEGTTTDGHSLLPFKSAMLKVLEPPPEGVMVQPVFLDYGDVAEWIGWIGDEGGLNNFMRVLARRGSFELRMHFLPPFSPADHPGRKAIAARAREEIEAALRQSLGREPRPFRHDVPPVRYSAPGSEAERASALDI
jgi:1-acyl-sn-glycerol-3-phosphate acyltransferase